MADRRVKVVVEAEVAGYRKGMQEASKATGDLAKSSDRSSDATRKLESAQRKASAAQDKAADAAGRLRVAQEKLNAARASGHAPRIVAAEEQVAKAQRDVERTAKEAATAQDALQREMESSGDAAQKSASRMSRFSKAVSDNRADIEQVGGALTAMGAVLTAVAGVSAKAAMSWESAWAGVLKTNDGTSEQIAQLEGDLRGLAKTLPATHSEIAAVAEAAGQLGVGIDDVSEFTKTMIDLGESTNLSAEEAATSLARFSNITGTAFSDVDKLGSAIVGLGNNFATTEAEIMLMSMRVAAVGTQVGMTEGEILGLSTAMSSVGVEAEAGGTAISMVMKKIDASVREGGESLTGWADAAGVSAQEFAAAWQSEPSKAMEMLVTGLGNAAAAGQDVNGTLADLGVTGIRESDTLLRLASAGELLGDAFRTGNEEFAKGSALAEEASKRYETTESKIRIAWNNIKDAAIDAGAVLLPVISTVADGAVQLANAFSGLPGPVQGGVTALAGISGVSLLAVGGIMKVLPAVNDTVEAFNNLAPAGSKARGALKGLGIASGIAVGVGALATAAIQIHNAAQEAGPSLEDMANALRQVGEAQDVAALDELFQIDGGSLIGDINSLADAFDALDPEGPAEHLNSFAANVAGVDNSTAKAQRTISDLDKVLATMSLEEAAGHVDLLRAELERAGRTDLSTWQELQTSLPEFAKSVQQAAEATGGWESEADLLRIALGILDPAARGAGEAAEGAGDGAEAGAAGIEAMAAASEELADQLDDALDNLRAMGAIPRDAAAAARDYEAALDDMAASIKENGNSLDITTEKGRANQAQLAELAQATLDHAAAAYEAGASTSDLAGIMAGGAQAVYDFALQLTGSKTEADALTRSIFDIPDNVDIETYMSTDALAEVEALSQAVQATPEKIEILSSMDDKAKAKAFETAEAIKAIPGFKKVDVAVDDQGTPGQIQARIDSLTGATEYVFVTDDGTVAVTQQKITGIDGKTENVYVTDDGTVVATQGSINNIEGKSVDVHAVAHTSDAAAAIARVARDRTVNIIGKFTGSAAQAMRRFGQGAVADGGRAGRDGTWKALPGLAAGGRLPYTGLGTDQILGIGSHGQPTAWVDDLEWVVNRRSSDKYDRLLGLINADHASVQHLAGYAAGGRVGREWSGSAMSTASMSTDNSRTLTLAEGAVQVASADPAVAARMAVDEIKHLWKTEGW